MKKFSLFFLVIFNPVLGQNLVPNGDFECYKELSCEPQVVPLDQLLCDWSEPTSSTPDYYHLDLPPDCYLFGGKEGFDTLWGRGMLGLSTYNYVPFVEEDPSIQENFREYAQVELASVLQERKLYKGGFKVRSSKSEKIFTNNIGMSFSDSVVNLTDDPFFSELLPAKAKVYSKEVIVPESGWVSIEGCFQGTGVEQYLLLGNFSDDFSTQKVVRGEPSGLFNYSYCYLDEVSVVEMPYDISGLADIYYQCPGNEFSLLDASVEGATGYGWPNGSSNSFYEKKFFSDTIVPVDIMFNECVYRHLFSIKIVKDIVLEDIVEACAGEEIYLDSGHENGQVLWFTGENTRAILAKGSGVYAVQLLNSGSCLVDDTTVVRFEECPRFVPNAISPNGDAYNQFFVVDGIERNKWELIIVNRWGETVYSSDRYQNNWDASNVSAGVYFYRLFSPELKKEVKGYVQVIK